MYARRKTILKGQVVGTAFSSGFLSGRERSGGTLRVSGRLRRERRSHRSSTGSSGYGSGTTHHIIGTDIVEPAAIELVGIDIERDGDIFTHLDIELLDTVFAKNAKNTFPGELSRNFDNIILRHP